MAAGVIAGPESPLGPCSNEDCGHRDCAELRVKAGCNCGLCQEPIGFGVRFYEHDADYGLVHAVCLEEAIDADH